MKKKVSFLVFWTLIFAGALLVLSRVGYSDGDDTYFYHYANSMGFFDYLSWRYENWVGRMAGEALVYTAFRLGLWFWRIVNAGMLVLLPLGVLRLSRIASGVRGFDAEDWTGMGFFDGYGLGAAVAAVFGYLLMGAMTLGYAAVWVNGSIFYTWTFTCGIYALIPLAELVFSGNRAEKGERVSVGLEGTDWKKFLYAIPCCVIASMSVEQMGAVLLVFEILGLLYCLLRKKRVNILMLVQTVLTLAAFLVLFAAPGNEIRVAAETASWMPEYEGMSFGQHLFITVQWLLSSFANENKLFLCGIWIVCILLLLEKRETDKKGSGWIAAAAVFLISVFLPYAGIHVLSDMGIHIEDITLRVDAVPSVGELSGGNAAAMLWWTAALVFTFAFLLRAAGIQAAVLLAYLAGIASEAIMFFSPTMYASGARVYYLTDILYLFVMLCLSMEVKDKKKRTLFYCVLAALGTVNFLVQIPVFLGAL